MGEGFLMFGIDFGEEDLEALEGSFDEFVYKHYFSDAKREIHKRIGLGTLLTGSDSCPGDVLYVSESMLSVEGTDTADAGAHIIQWSGYLKGWRDVLFTFCQKTGIPFTEPKWLLATRYF